MSKRLSGSGSGSLTLWRGDLCFVGGNVQEAGGGTRGVAQIGDGEYGQALEGQGLEKRVGGECTQIIQNAHTGDVY